MTGTPPRSHPLRMYDGNGSQTGYGTVPTYPSREAIYSGSTSKALVSDMIVKGFIKSDAVADVRGAVGTNAQLAILICCMGR